MRALHPVSIVLALSFSTLAVAQQFDGSVPMSCTVTSGFDCLPGNSSCGPIKRESNIEPVFKIDVAKKQVRSPFRTSLLPISHSASSDVMLVLQGGELKFAWSGLIKKATGEMTITVADTKGAYVAFGQCKIAGASADSATKKGAN